jgi:hypothetical protein
MFQVTIKKMQIGLTYQLVSIVSRGGINPVQRTYPNRATGITNFLENDGTLEAALWGIVQLLPPGGTTPILGDANLESLAAAAAGVAQAMPNDFRVSSTDAPGEKGYPISSSTRLLVPAEFSGKGKLTEQRLTVLLGIPHSSFPSPSS